MGSFEQPEDHTKTPEKLKTEKERKEEIRKRLASAMSSVLAVHGYKREKNRWTKAPASPSERPKIFRLRRSNYSHTYYIDGSRIGTFDETSGSAELSSMVGWGVFYDETISEEMRAQRAREERENAVSASDFEVSKTKSGKSVSDEEADEKIKVLCEYLEKYGVPWVENAK
jgi:hypothetical protein